MRIERSYRRALAAAVVALGLLAAGPAFGQSPAACAGTKAELKRIDDAIAQLDRAALPGRLAADLIDVLDQLIDGLKNTKSDLANITGSVNKAKGKLDEIAKTLKDSKLAAPSSLTTLTGAIDGIATGIQGGIKKFNASGAGQTADGLRRAQDYIGNAVDQLQKVRDAVDVVKTLIDAKEGTNADQIKALKAVIDSIGGMTGASEVPGVAQFLQAYSTALGSMYGSVNEVETSLKDRLNKVNALLSDVGITPIEYPGLQTLAERRRAALDALRAEKAKLEADLAAQTCDQAARIDPCTQRPAGSTLDTPDDTRRLVDQMTAKLRDDYTTLDQIAQIAFTESLQHAYARPRRESGEAQAAFDGRLERWNDTRTVLAANLKSSAAQRDAAKTAWQQAVVNDVAHEAAAKNWSDTQTKLFDECFPDYVRLRKEIFARAAAAVGNPAANPSSQKDCGTTGGIAGAVENVACQESR